MMKRDTPDSATAEVSAGRSGQTDRTWRRRVGKAAPRPVRLLAVTVSLVALSFPTVTQAVPAPTDTSAPTSPSVPDAQGSNAAVASTPPSVAANGTSPPLAPTSLVATANGSTVTLTWIDQSNDETSFDIQRARLVAGVWGEFTTLTATAANSTGSTDTGVPDAQYSYLVRATNAIGSSAWVIAQVTVNTASAAPNAPTGFTAVPTGSSVALNWVDQSNNETSFEIQRARYAAGVWTDWTGFPVDKNVTTATDSPVADGQYAYLVRATNAIGSSAWVIIQTTVNTATTTPNAPTSVTAVATGSSVTLTWIDQSANETLFEIQRARFSAGQWTEWTSFVVDKNITTFTDPTLADGQYAYLIRATNAIGSSAWVTAQVVVSTANGAPGALTAIVTDAIRLTWKSPSGPDPVVGYDVLRDGVVLVSLGNITTYTDSAVTPGTSYSYTVRARLTSGALSALSVPAIASGPAAFDSRLRRAPYLTDLVGLNATINFATDRSATNGAVSFGPVTNGVCTLSGSTTATAIPITVNKVLEFQWKARLTLPATGNYCYRVTLNGIDLLGANSSPQFTTQVPVGSAEPFSFAVLGDWGQVDSNGNNSDQSSLMNLIANSGARFAISTGDNGYPSGSQGNYGDLVQKTADTSAIFGPTFWAWPGKSIPLFPIIGNHGLARGDTVHPQFANWPQDVATASSGGSATKTVYPSVNGSKQATYPSPWYAFDAGGARFYLLDAAWADLNVGTSTPYGNDYASHWTPSSAEYLWLKADLEAHPSGLKFAFFHYPLYSDQPSETGNTFLQGASSLEGLLGANGVNIGFNGHAHIYQRTSAAPGGLITYVTGGGGGTAQSLTTPALCSPLDQYAVGWSYTKGLGSKCGLVPGPPQSPSQVYHYLKVSISGTQVTVMPIDATGTPFDIQTYNFPNAAHTYIDSSPPAGTNSGTAVFTFHSSSANATSSCTLDGGAPTACISPATYSNLPQGTHTFSVVSSTNGVVEARPAVWSWKVDTTPPGLPTGLAATAVDAFDVNLTWTAASDNLETSGYNLFRDGTLLASIGAQTTFTDTTVLGGSVHQYAVQAFDISGDTSAVTAPVSVTLPAAPIPAFSDGFETGTFGAWTSTAGLVVQGATTHSGTHAAEGNTTNGMTFANKKLATGYADSYTRIWFDVLSQNAQINLLRFRPADIPTGSLGYLYLRPTGELAYHNDVVDPLTDPDNVDLLTGVFPGAGWHSLEAHFAPGATAGATGTLEVWLDNVQLPDLATTTINLGTVPLGGFQIGEASSSTRAYDVVFDDVAFGPTRLGPIGDTTPPSAPTNVVATATSPFSVGVSWAASNDDVGVAGYDVFRDNGAVPLASVAAGVTSYSDTTVLPGSLHTYQVRAVDAAANPSLLSTPPASVTLPPPAQPAFSDGFEANNMLAWTTTSGLSAEAAVVHTGAFAAEGVATAGAVFARKVVSPIADAYGRVWLNIVNQSTQANVLRLRDPSGSSVGYLYVTTTGKLGFHNDGVLPTTNTTSTTTLPSGWHALELHLGLAGAASTIEVWLDGVKVNDLSSFTANLGSVATIGQFQIGEHGTSGAFDIAFDDAAFGSSRIGPTVDVLPPTAPTNVTATATTPFSVGLTWTASTDDTGVIGYDVIRDGAPLTSLGAVTTYTDSTVQAGSTHTYQVRARDSYANLSPLSTPPASVTLPAASAPVFADGFESGGVTAWTASAGLNAVATPGSPVHSGTYAADGNPAGTANIYARKNLTAAVPEGFGRVWFDVVAQTSQLNLLRFQDAAGASIGYVYLSPSTGKLAFHNDTTTLNTVSATATVTPLSGWHSVELHVLPAGTASTVEVWLDSVKVADLSTTTANLSNASSIGRFQIGDTGTGTYHVLYDDAAFGTARLGAAVDTNAPTVPTGVAASAPTAFSVAVGWNASSDDTAVTAYDVFRNGTLIASVGAVTAYTDSTALASTTYSYTVRARDAANNASAQSTAAPVTTPAATAATFADGFESGDLAVWTTKAGLVVTPAQAHAGTRSAEGNVTSAAAYARKTLPTPTADGYARVWFNIQSRTGQVNLLRLRDATGALSSIGYLFVSSSGKLSFRNDASPSTITSNTATITGPGWHALELHLNMVGATSTLEVWLDGVKVNDLSTTINVGALTTIGQLQIGETGTGTYDVFYDDAAFGTSRLGL